MTDSGVNHVMSATQMNQQGLRPVPDPTTLTTEALQREIKGLGEILRAEIKIAVADATGNQEALAVRLGGLERTVSALEVTTKERFDITEKQRVEQKQDNEKAVQAALLAAEKAVQAALLAQKEAVREQTAASALAISKSESSTAAQQSQQYATITAELKAVTDRLGDQGNRLTTIESSKLGQTEQRQTQQTSQAGVIALVVAGIAVAGFIVTLVALLPR